MSGSLTRDPIAQHILKDETDIPALGYKGETDIPALGQGVSGHHRHSLVQLGEEKRLIRVNEGLESHPSPVKGEVGGWRGCAGYEINERRESRDTQLHAYRWIRPLLYACRWLLKNGTRSVGVPLSIGRCSINDPSDFRRCSVASMFHQ
ncbi:hypothetical protein L1887_11008 [Cichorium endivia]|nr:hypothetical protein L1887_11008 [Cichorium endivia]